METNLFEQIIDIKEMEKITSKLLRGLKIA